VYAPWISKSGNIRTLSIPLPPLAEQNRILTKLKEMLEVCDRLEAQLSATQEQRGILLESVLHHALNDSGPCAQARCSTLVAAKRTGIA
jgi:hypothetical protein